RSRSPVTNEAHRCPKRTEQFHHSKKAPLPKANRTIPQNPKRPRQPGEQNNSIKHKKAPAT
ncbi:hypothetical protein, partial [Atlantibacter hermannii]|uniref:hypothetical protein n=1 Tax=Atlantibacter hermannii TaxID=565 RepID=UPI0028B244F4